MKPSPLLPVISFVIILGTLGACGPKPAEERILGKWRFERIEISATIDPSEKTMDAMAGLAFSEAMMKDMSYEFFRDMTFELSKGGRGTSGTYQLINDGKYLEMTNPRSQDENPTEKMEILLLTEDTLKLDMMNTAALVFSRMPN